MNHHHPPLSSSSSAIINNNDQRSAADDGISPADLESFVDELIGQMVRCANPSVLQTTKVDGV
jgi:hypothetical protein